LTPTVFAGMQVESSMAVQTLKPRVEMIKARYGDDKSKIQRETNFLYEQAGVNPLAGEQK
jgi:YidC/Oxa1 family membrane protein insertase